uniref:SH2 domain-containing protein n=1 Tax=Bubo bubo TaxID=30461 RepID=A0A8C0EIK8_BUBBB
VFPRHWAYLVLSTTTPQYPDFCQPWSTGNTCVPPHLSKAFLSQETVTRNRWGRCWPPCGLGAREIGWELLHRGSCSLSAEKLFPASREAENLLSDKPLGCFLVRISQSRPGYTLTYRGEHRCRHYMIQVQPNVRYVILGEDRAHASLTELVRYHQTVGIQPFMEILTVPCGQVNVKDLQPEKGWGMDRAVSGQSHCSSKISLLCSPAKGETPPEVQPCPSSLSTSRPALQSRAATVLRHVWFKNNSFQSQESLDKSRTKPSSGKERGSQRAFPRLRSSIRLAMQEIQQVSWGISSTKH